MSPNQSEKIEQLFHTARALPAAERAAYLAAHCASDDEARQAVERLLRGHEAAGDFLETPAVKALPEKLSGRRLAHYQLHMLLGKGGMGEVYLAEDTRLHRKVALKLLPAHFTSEADRVRRFEREAIAASGLNHPNILTVYEISQERDTHYIATEYIAGSTLRQRLSEGRLPLRTALDIAVQTASALVAAHEAGIVHRDIKPENVMLRSDGLVKVLDFGLAKLAETRKVERGAPSEEAATLLQDAPAPPQLTDPGTVMGTASYMSPEQARGQEVDARSDIFSLGVMLYEMLAGRAPFAGVNPIDVLGAILHQEAVPLSQLVTNLPAELHRIVNKALRKDRDERYQHSKELWLDLNDLRRELEFEEKLKARQNPSSNTSEPMAAVPTANDGRPTEGALTQPTVSSAKIILGELKRHKTGAIAGLVVLLGGVLALAYGLYRFAAPQSKTARFQNVKLTPLTSVGNVGGSVCISPDGKFIAYVQIENGKKSLWTKAIAGGSAIQIVPPEENNLAYLTFAPDGNSVYYQRQETGRGDLYQVPVLGGTPKRILSRIFTTVTFSPDGSRFAYARGGGDLGATQAVSELVIVNADGSNERVLATRKRGERFSNLSWSPDGKIIAATVSMADANNPLLGISVESGESKPLGNAKQHMNFFDVAWLKDGSGLLVTASDESSDRTQIWLFSYPSGELQRVTNDLARYIGLSLTAENHTLVARQIEMVSHLWIKSLDGTGQARQLTARDKSREGSGGMKWTPDGRILFVSDRSGNLDLWVMNADGSNARQLTDTPAVDILPVCLPDGHSLVFNSVRSGKSSLWRVDMDGSNSRPIPTGELPDYFALSPDGRWIVFDSFMSGVYKLYKMPIEGGNAVQLTDQIATRPAISPDGKLIACLTFDEQSKKPRVLLLPFEGGAPIKTLEAETVFRYVANPLGWMPDGKSLLYIDTREGMTNLWRLPIDGSPSQRVTNFNDAKPEQIWAFDLAPDGKQLLLARGGFISDVVLISEVK